MTHANLEPAETDDTDTDEGVEANARLTGTTALVLLLLLAVEGFTILKVGALLTLHVVVGMVLIPPVLLKIGSTSWRFARYYLGSPAYRRKGPPPALLRLLGPIVVVLTLAVLGSGVALLLGPSSTRQQLLLLHKATFILWLGAMAIHVLGHFAETMRLAPKDFYWRTRNQVRGATKRQWALIGSLCIGVLLGIAVVPKVGPWLTAGQQRQGQSTVVHHPIRGAQTTIRRLIAMSDRQPTHHHCNDTNPFKSSCHSSAGLRLTRRISATAASATAIPVISIKPAANPTNGEKGHRDRQPPRAAVVRVGPA